MSEKFARMLEKRSRYPYARLIDGNWRFACCEGLTLPMTPPMFDMDRKLADLDNLGIDVAVLSLGAPGPELIGGKRGDQIAREHNDLLAEIIAARPDRFWGYATLGFGDIEVSLRELDRCMGQLKFRGLQLFSNIRGKPLDAEEFRPVFARMAELGRPIFIHPTVPLNRNYLADLIPVPALGFIVDTTLAAMRLALSGRLTEFSTAPVIIPHVGGAIPYLMPRLAGSMMTHHRGEDPTSILKALYMDTVVHRVEPLRWCYETMGADHILFGTDHPYGQWARRTIEALDQLQCSGEDKDKICYANAERLFPPA
ncbi:MAG: amidohydrolase [Candidatus Binataceae bacterium]|nr:amidohydrolase [Candidatus Binataceae bacterium]